VPGRSLPEETRIAILDAAWDLIAERGAADVGMAAIAARAGVSRQTLHLAFGDRAGMLNAMLRRKDRKSAEAERLYAFAGKSAESIDSFIALIEAWLDYLPIIYSVGIQLDAAALNDIAAAAAWDDRMKGTLLNGFRVKLEPLGKSGLLAPGWTADRAAELAWSLVHPVSWRLLVIECGWSVEEFRHSRKTMIRFMLFTRQCDD
jgi:AcrR family transcriptional regulator